MKAFFLPYLFFILFCVISIANFDNNLKKFIVQGVASYNLTYEFLKPSAYLCDRLMVDTTKEFENNKNIILLLGNSIVQGSGAKDRNYLNKYLSKNYGHSYNIINAGLGGEYLTASISIAIISLKNTLVKNDHRRIKIFVVYPPTRFYAFGNYWAFGKAIKTLSLKYNVEEYIFGLDRIKGNTAGELLFQPLKARIIGGLPYIFNYQTISDWINHKRFYLRKLFESVEVRPGFLDQYYSNSKKVENPNKFLKKNTDWLNKYLSVSNYLINRIEFLTRFLNDFEVNYELNLLVISESPDFLGALDEHELGALDAKIEDFSEEICRHPSWRVFRIPPFEESDYFDSSHLKESGQRSLAENIVNIASG